MRVSAVIVNDTRTAFHYGCEAVMAAVFGAVEQRGGAICHTHPVGIDWRQSCQTKEAIERADLVIVNGEGTIHHSRPGATSLAALGPYCAARKKPAFLINATIAENDLEIMKNLVAFTGIWVREQPSRAELAAFGKESTVTGDLTFWHTFAEPLLDRPGTLVTDDVLKPAARNLALIADELNAPFASLKRHGNVSTPTKRRVFWRSVVKDRPTIPEAPTFTDFVALMGRYGNHITGRFHALCFLISLGLPARVMPSSTWKIEALLDESGLSANRLFAGSKPPAPMPLTANERQNISEYTIRARSRLSTMFDNIVSSV